MEPRTGRDAQPKPEASKTDLPVSSDDENLDIFIQTGPKKERRRGNRTKSSANKKAGTATAQKRAKTEKRKKREGNSIAGARPAAKKKAAAAAGPTATNATKKGNSTGQKRLRRKCSSTEREQVESLKIQLASTQEALQKVLQCYCVEFLPHSQEEKDRDASEVTTESMVHREIHTLKRLVSFITGGQVPLSVPPDFFYVLGKQYLEGTWTDICAAAARAAPQVSGNKTDAAAAAERAAVSVETVHEIPPFTARKSFNGNAAAAGSMQSAATAAAPAAPDATDLSGAASSVAQIEEVEQLIRVEIEGEEPMEWRDVYRLPAEGPPVLVSSSANKSACAATVSTETVKRETSELLQQGSDEPKGRQQPPSHIHIMSRQHQRQNTTDSTQQQERVIFTLQQQHAAERTCKEERDSSRSSVTPAEEGDRTGGLAPTLAGQSVQGRQVIPSGELLPQSCSAGGRSSGSCSASQIEDKLLEERLVSTGRRRDSEIPSQTEKTKHGDLQTQPPGFSSPWKMRHSSVSDTQCGLGNGDSRGAKEERVGNAWGERSKRLSRPYQTKAFHSGGEAPVNDSELLPAVVSPRGETRMGKGLKESEGMSDFPSALLKAAAEAPPRKQQPQPQFASPALTRATATAAEKQQLMRKAAQAQQNEGPRRDAPAQDTPDVDDGASRAAPGHGFYMGESGSGGSRAAGDRWTSADRRPTNLSSSVAIGGIVTGRGGAFEAVGDSRASEVQGEPRDSERPSGSKTPAIASLFGDECCTRLAEAAGTAADKRREKQQAFSEKPSMSREESETSYFVPAPGRRRESMARRSSVDVVYMPAAVPLGYSAPSAPSEKQGRQQGEIETPRPVGGSASPIRGAAATPVTPSGGATGTAAVRDAFASTPQRNDQECMQHAYIFDFLSNTGGASPPPSTFYYTPTQLPASPPPSPVIPFPPAAGAAATGVAAQHSNIYAVAAGHRRIFVPPSAAYPYGALLPESFVLPPPPPSPASPIPTGWKTCVDAKTMPMLLAAAAAAHETDVAASPASPRTERSKAVEDARDQQEGEGKTAAAAAGRNKVTTTEEKGEKMWRRRRNGSGNSSENGEQKREQAVSSSAGLQAKILPFPAIGSAATLSLQPHAEERRMQGVQHRQLKTAGAYLHLLHPAAAPRSLNGTPRWQEGGRAVATRRRDVPAGDTAGGGYDEAAAAALGCKVYRDSVGSGSATYDVFKTAAVQAVLLAHAREVFVPVFWNEDGAPISWPRVKVPLSPSAAARAPQSSEEQQPQQQRRQYQLQDKRQQDLDLHQRKQQQRQSAASEEEESRQTSLFAPVPCFHDGEPQKPSSTQQERQEAQHDGLELLRFSPPAGWQFQWWGQGDTKRFPVESSAVLSQVAPPFPLSARHVSEDQRVAQSNTEHAAAGTLASSTSAPDVSNGAVGAGSAVSTAPSAVVSAGGSGGEDMPVTPWCSFRHPPLPPYSGLLGTHFFTSTCCAAPSGSSSAKSRKLDRGCVSNLQEQQHKQQQWTETKEPLAGQAAAYRRATAANRMRRVPPTDTSGSRQTVVRGGGLARKTATRCPAALPAETLSSAATPTTAGVPYWSFQESSRRSRLSPQQQQASAEKAGRLGDAAQPRLDSHNEEVPTSRATLERLDSILKEASDLDARLKEVDGKVEKLLKGRRRRVVDP